MNSTIRYTAVVENNSSKEKCNANEAIIVSIGDNIKDGIKLYEEKQKNKTKKITIEPLNKEISIIKHNCEKMMIRKGYYPKEKKFKGCNHSGNKIIPKRDIITREDHRKLLSEPKKVYKTDEMNFCVLYRKIYLYRYIGNRK